MCICIYCLLLIKKITLFVYVFFFSFNYFFCLFIFSLCLFISDKAITNYVIKDNYDKL